MALIKKILGDKIIKTSIMPKITEQKQTQGVTKVNENEVIPKKD